MQGKKRYLALVLFLLLGLITFSFANPDDQLEPVEGNVKKVSEQKDEKKVQTKFEKAEELVEQAEQNPTEEIIAEAEEAIEEAEQEEPELVEEEDLVNRLNNTEPAIDAAALISAVEKMIDEASKKDDVVAAKTYFDNNQVATVTDTLEDGTVKENLEERVAYLVKVFADTTNPVITGIENNQTTNIDVTLTIEDDIKVEKVVTLNGEAIEYKDTFDKEGTYVVTVTDDAQNTTSITFTIDKTKPKFEGLSSREAHVEGYTVDITDATATIITMQKDHGEFVEIPEGTIISEEGTYQLVAVDAAENKYTTWVIVDRTEPTITGVTNGSYVNKCDRIYVADRYLSKVTINDETYDRDDFTHNTKNEDFKFEKRVCAEGTYTITATDKRGLTRTETFTIDKTAISVASANMYTNGKKYTIDKDIYYYATNGQKITAYVRVKEKSQTLPVITITIDGKDYILDNVIESFHKKEDEEAGIYKYEGTFIIPEDMSVSNATISYTVTNITDKAGNETTVKKVTNKNIIVVDTAKPTYKFYKEGSSLDKDEIQPTILNGKLYFNQNVRVRFAEGAHFTQYIHNDFVNNENKTTIKSWQREALNDGEHTMKVTDAAGNVTEVTFVIDTKAPTYKFYKEGSSLEKDEIQPTIVDGKLYFNKNVRVVFAEETTYFTQYIHNDFVNNENKNTITSWQREVLSDGEHTMKVTDAVGNVTEVTFIVDTKAPIANYVAILQKGDNYQYATNGNVIRFLVQFNEEIAIPKNKDDRTFILSINGKEVKFQRSQGTGYEYIAEYKIPKDEETLVEGELTFLISGYNDFAGNVGEPITTAKHAKYNKVIYDKTPITYALYQPGVRPVKVVDTVELDGKLYIGEPAEVQFHDKFRIDSIQVNDGKPYITTPGVTGQLVYIREPGEYTYTLIDGVGLVTKITLVYVDNSEFNLINKDINLTGDVTLVNSPFYNIKENTQNITINGNGYTVTQHVTSVDEFNWTENGTRTTMGNIFSSSNNSTMTIKDINFEGTVQSMLLGHYVSGNKQEQSFFTTELDNVDAIGLEVVSLSANISPAFYTYGKANLNKVNIYDTKLSELDTDPMWPVYDLGIGNYSTVNIDDSKIGSIITWTHSITTIKNSEIDVIDSRAFWTASHQGKTTIEEGTTVGRINIVPEKDYDTKYGYSLTIKKGATVKVLDVSKITNMTYIIIEDGAIIEKVITADGEMTYEEYLGQNSTINQFKKAFKTGGEYKFPEDIVLDSTVELASDKSLVIDLNGKTLELKDEDDNIGKIISKGNLTIKNGTLENNNIEKNTLIDKEDGTLNLEGVTVNDKASYSGTTIFNRKGLMTINNTTFNIDSINTGCKVDSNGNLLTTDYCGNTTVENYGDLVITNSTINSNASVRYGITTRAGNVTVDNVKFEVRRRGAMGIEGGNVTVDNSTVNSYWYAFYVTNKYGNTNVTINSGTYTASGYSIIYNGNYVKTNKGLVTINGGTFWTQSNKRNLLTLDGTVAEGQEFDIAIKGGTWKATKNNAADYVADGYIYNNGTVKPE